MPQRRPGSAPDPTTSFVSTPAFPRKPWLDDGSEFGGWLTGQVARASLVGALAASALAGSAARAQWQDESQPSPHIEEESFAPRVPFAPLAYLSLYLPDADEVLSVAVAAPGQPDEDYWTSGVAPTLAALFQQLPFCDDSDLAVIAVATTLAPDEDFWALGPAPSPAPASRIYLPDGDDLAVTAVATVVDEDGWTPPRALSAGAPRAFADDSDFVSPKLDEDGWIPAAPQRNAPLRLAFAEQDEVFPVVAAPLGIDEEVWVPAPMRVVTYAPIYLPDAEDVPAGFLFVPAPFVQPVDPYLAWLQLRAGFHRERH